MRVKMHIFTESLKTISSLLCFELYISYIDSSPYVCMYQYAETVYCSKYIHTRPKDINVKILFIYER